MRGHPGHSNPNGAARPSLKFNAYRHATTSNGGNATMRRTVRDASYPTALHVQGMQDVLLVASFALWAVLLGLSPVLALRLLAGS
jgi:hypothetical protein